MIPRSLLILTLAGLALLPSARAATDYKGAIVIDAASGSVLFEDHADLVSPPASVTKLMTFLVVHDAIAAGRLTLSTPVTADATDQSMGGTQVNLAAGETFTVEELLHAMMIESANDAAHALSHAAAAGRESFVAAMNARARSLGMANTTFRTPHGLPPASRKIDEGDLTTPRDLALLARKLVTHTDVLRYTSTRTRFFGAGVRTDPQPMRNHNKLLEAGQGIDGLKTGYTAGAGFCLAATAGRKGRRVIAVVMGSPSSKERDRRVAALIDAGFAQLPADALFHGYTAPASPITPMPLDPREAPLSPAPAADSVPTVKFTLPARK